MGFYELTLHFIHPWDEIPRGTSQAGRSRGRKGLSRGVRKKHPYPSPSPLGVTLRVIASKAAVCPRGTDTQTHREMYRHHKTKTNRHRYPKALLGTQVQGS